jgi:Domain of unknown function (DUF397)
MAGQLAWRVATYTGGQGNCVEVADNAGAFVVRDTKNRDGGTLAFTGSAWERFTTSLR